MKKFLLYIIFLLLASNLDAQVNLVPNPSFETYSSCPTGSSQVFLAIPWQGVTTNSSDYYNVCGTGGATVPNNGGWQFARTGVAYAAIWVLQGSYREYLQVKLDSVLKLDSCYLVEFYCNAHNLSAFGINKMAAALSNTAINTTVGGSGSELSFTPQIVSNQFLADTVNWMRVSGYYKANGGEQYITIGNFSSTASTDTIHIGGTPFGDAYYYIDDVTVRKIVGCDTTTKIEEYNNGNAFKLYPNPNNGNMIFEYSLSEMSTGMFVLYDITGRIINKYQLTVGQNNTLKVCENELQNGVYFYTVIIDGKVKAHSKIIIVK